ncbi:metallophosphoesterase [Sphaerospermopsis kisseleviana CS-549]|uniref:Metallophosphoesterase n=1 Tax=Sphaerospermopsis kisseleviana CS-549 TaxID=3021783 RepID=A0ABT4ZXQ3_9CYAN|nr:MULTISPECIES: metallophosphoesterase [Sphaerospermopsis]MBD2147249.1 metallophosphoesterase [Sphaerospermopsis sp. FACHB-1194]MDB9444064.1 metallophosphoesterase [Sphaerospermopsis kisseleviana CS-549]BAZ80274.1 metallophosphoesterase [Sphaerospermopsis kisseleviana NIES-73]
MHRLLSGPLTTEKLTVKIAGLPASLQGKKLVQMSDFHYDGVRLSDKMLSQAIAIANQAKPDLILLTGDFITTSTATLDQLAKYLKKLQSRHGIYAVLGNHDLYYKNSQTEVTTTLTNIGIHVLWNQISYPLGKELPIVGLADFYSKEFNPTPVMNQLDPDTPCIVLSHNPDTAEILQKWRVDLQLSGHTHGGQIVIPGLGPVLMIQHKILRITPKILQNFLPFFRKKHPVCNHWEWSQGFHKIGKNQLYINRGLGTYLPGRLFCPPEVTIITLQSK